MQKTDSLLWSIILLHLNEAFQDSGLGSSILSLLFNTMVGS